MKEIVMSLAKTVMISFCSAVCTIAAVAVTSALAIVAEGDKVPDFTLPDDHGKPTKPSDFQGKRFIVFFYDVDREPFAKNERVARMADIKKFKLEDTDVLCIGTDPVASHKAMTTHGQFPLDYHLLTDKNDSVRTATFGFPTAVKGQHNHYALVVDKDLTIKKLVDGSKTANKEESMASALRYLGDFGVSAY
jgi:peroxiredoxin